MPKVIQPKRHNKTVSAQSYWQLREKASSSSNKVKQQAVISHRQDEVNSRYRYLKPTEQSKLFNPLAYFYQNVTAPSKAAYSEGRQQEHQTPGTHVQEFLESVRFRVSPQLIRIKKYTFGLESILYNHEKIYEILWSSLDCDEAWKLLQAMTKDTANGHSFKIWVKEGLRRLVATESKQQLSGNEQPTNHNAESPCSSSIFGTTFNQTKMQYLFDALSIFMEANYDQIMQNLTDFLEIMNQCFFTHENKYIRKFSLRAVSYIINNVSLEQNLQLIFKILLNNSLKHSSNEGKGASTKDKNTQEIPIGEMLLNRHKAVRGCFSSAEISKIVQTFKQVPNLFQNRLETANFDSHEHKMNQETFAEFEQEISDRVEEMMVYYGAGILSMLETKYGRTMDDENKNTQILFDLNYVIKALISLQEKHSKSLSEITLVKTFSLFLSECDQKKFLTHNPKHQSYINDTFKLILSFLQQVSTKLTTKTSKGDQLQDCRSMNELLGFMFKLSPDQSSEHILSKGITTFCQRLEIGDNLELLQNIYQSNLEESLNSKQIQHLGEFLFLAFSKYIKQFVMGASKKNANLTSDMIEQREQWPEQKAECMLVETLYTFHQICKRINFDSPLNLSYLGLSIDSLIDKAQSHIQAIPQFIVFTRILTLLNFKEESLDSENNKTVEKQLENFVKALASVFKKVFHPFSACLEQLVLKDQQGSLQKSTKSSQQPHNWKNSENYESEAIRNMFNYDYHVGNLLQYSHHEVEWINLAFNIESSYRQLVDYLPCSATTKGQALTDTRDSVLKCSELSLNRAVSIPKGVSLAELLEKYTKVLQSRNHQTRFTIIERIYQTAFEVSHGEQTNLAMAEKNHEKADFSQEKDLDNNTSVVIQQILNSLMLIDQEEVDLNNERDVKKQFLTLERAIDRLIALESGKEFSSLELSRTTLIQLLLNWSLGFAFTGFKLINDSFISFCQKIFQSYPQAASETVNPFLRYYAYRHSRQFEYDMNFRDGSFILNPPANTIKPLLDSLKNEANENFYSLMKQDFKVYEQNTIQWIGIERIAQTIHLSRKLRNQCQEAKGKFTQMLTVYFAQEFFRKRKLLENFQHGDPRPAEVLLLPPKTRFLTVMLKTCPDSYLPPFQCLHFVTNEYFSLTSVSNVKKNHWEAIWNKRAKGSKSKEQISEHINTTIPLETMSTLEQEMYVHFLWKEIISANNHKRRSILEHIRDRLSKQAIGYFLRSFIYREVFNISETNAEMKSPNLSELLQSDSQNGELLKNIKTRLLLENRKTLLNGMFVLKSVFGVFRNYLTNQDNGQGIQNFVNLSKCLISLVYENGKSDFDSLKQNEETEQEIEAEEESDQQSSDQDLVMQQEKNPQHNITDNKGSRKNEMKSPMQLYKPHRKQIFKLLIELLTNYRLSYEQAKKILRQLSESSTGVGFNDKHKIDSENVIGRDESHSRKSESLGSADTYSQSRRIIERVSMASVNSVPGLLLLLKLMSEFSFYHVLLLNFGLLDIVAGVLDIADSVGDAQNTQAYDHSFKKKKPQSNQHAVRICLEILGNLFQANDVSDKKQRKNKALDLGRFSETKIQEEYEEDTLKQEKLFNSIQTHIFQRKASSVENLLSSISHFIKFAKDTSQKDGKIVSNGFEMSQSQGHGRNTELEYYTQESKQNINSIKNLKNKGNAGSGLLIARNIDMVWNILAKILTQSQKSVSQQEKHKDDQKKEGSRKIALSNEWEEIFWNEINKVTKVRLLKEKHHQRLLKLVEISLIYFSSLSNRVQRQTQQPQSENKAVEEFICKIISILPHISKLAERFKIIDLINSGLRIEDESLGTNKDPILSSEAMEIVQGINSIKRVGLSVEMDYDGFFGAVANYCSKDHTKSVANIEGHEMVEESKQFADRVSSISEKRQFNLVSHQYVLYNLLPYLHSQELSVRKAVRQGIDHFLAKMEVHLSAERQTNRTQVANNQSRNSVFHAYNDALRLLIDQLKKAQIDSVFWSVLSCIGLFIRFATKFKSDFGTVFENWQLYEVLCSPLIKLEEANQGQKEESRFSFESESENDFFYLICSISQGNKMRGLKMLKERIVETKQSTEYMGAFAKPESCFVLTNPIPWLMSILEHLVLPIKQSLSHQFNTTQGGNLSSTLSHISLQIFTVIVPLARESLIKKQLKRLASKIKFNESSEKINTDMIKKNILLIKIISSIVEGIETLQKCTEKVRKYIKDYGFDDFHMKLVENARKTVKGKQDGFESSDDEDGDVDLKKGKKKEKVAFGENLEELLDEDEAINRNFMMFDKRLMALEEEEQMEERERLVAEGKVPQGQNSIAGPSESTLPRFLKSHILTPLKMMLFYEAKGGKNSKEEEDKSRMMLSVAITKLLIKFPMEMFLFEFQKVLSKICRLLKKNKLQVRQNGRKCLCQISRVVGPEMLYAIILELKFHLRDNFQKHVFNFSVHEIIGSLGQLRQGELDYCLPLILPMIVDEIFGRASEEKKMVDENEIPVLVMESKKKKGHELLIMLSRQLSADKVKYMIDYLEKFLKDYLNSEANLSKYEMLVNHLTNGLGHNPEFTSIANAATFGRMLCDSMMQLRKEIKIYNFSDAQGPTHETTVVTNTNKTKKVGKESLLLQEEAGKNGSIFKKMSQEVYDKRNHQILINCLAQFYLAILSLLVKKQVISIEALEKHFSVKETKAGDSQMDEQQNLQQNFLKITNFVFECMDHRDNRIVSKAMKILHQVLIWNFDRASSTELQNSMKTLRKKVSRKILLFVEKLTSADEQLLKESFTILIDLFSQVTISKEILPTIVAMIKLHSAGSNEEGTFIPEPYRLLRIVLQKMPTCLYDPMIYELYENSRLNIINCHQKDIRGVCQSIARVYVQGEEGLKVAVEGSLDRADSERPNEGHAEVGRSGSRKASKKNKGKNAQKYHEQQPSDKHLKGSIHEVYARNIKKELTFYLSNIDCKFEENQLSVLEVLSQWIQNRTKAEVEDYSELIILSLATSVVNGNQHTEKISQMVKAVLRSINKAKVIDLLDKGTSWLNHQQTESSKIQECGCWILTVVLSAGIVDLESQAILINQIGVKSGAKSKVQEKDQPKQENLLSGIGYVLEREVNTLEDYLSFQKRNNSKGETNFNKDVMNDVKWNSIFEAIDNECENPYLEDKKVLVYCLDILKHLVSVKSVQKFLKQGSKESPQNCQFEILSNVWRLLRVPKQSIAVRCIEVLMEVDQLGQFLQLRCSSGEGKDELVSTQIGSKNAQNATKQQNEAEAIKISFNYKQTITTLIKNYIDSSHLKPFVSKFHQEPPTGEQTFVLTFEAISTLVSKILTKFKTMEPFFEPTYDLLIEGVLENTEKVEPLIYKCEAYQNKLIDMLGKVARNEFVSSECKAVNERAIEIVKEAVGMGEFYKKMARFQSERKEKKTEYKVKLAQLAVTDQKAHYELKKQKNKRVKKEETDERQQ